MKRLLTIGLLIMATLPAYAQTTDLNIKATPAEVDLIWKGLRELPVKDVEAFMAKMRQQVMEQTAPKPVAAPKPEFPPNNDMVKKPN